jgi:hypothetical protein
VKWTCALADFLTKFHARHRCGLRFAHSRDPQLPVKKKLNVLRQVPILSLKPVSSADSNKMKTQILKGLLILIGAGTLLTGCETTYDPGTSTSPLFPPAPPDKINAPNSPAVNDK